MRGGDVSCWPGILHLSSHLLSLYETQGLRAPASLDPTLDTKTPDSEDVAATGAQSLSSPAEWMDADDEWTLFGSIPRGDGVTISDMDLILFSAASLGMLCMSSGPREFSASLFVSSFFTAELSASFVAQDAASPPSMLLSEKSMLKGLVSSGLVS